MLILSSLVSVQAVQDVSSTLQHTVDTAGPLNYLAAETQQQQRQLLEGMKAKPHDPTALAEQFSHGINSHLPHGVSSQPDPERLVQDTATGLLMDRPPGITDAQFSSMQSVLQLMAEQTVAYKVTQIEGYTGVEPPLRIPLTTTARIFCPPRRNWSVAELQLIGEKCKELLDARVAINIADSDYACNPVLAMKRAPDGTWSDKRFCINFIPINKFTELDRYGSHKADDLFQRVAQSKYLTALDLRSGFHQIPVDPKDIPKAAFWCVSDQNKAPQLMAYQRMPFGLKNAPAKFQRVMDAELARSGCCQFAFAYIDDLLIASSTWEEHVEHVSKVLKMLADCNLRIHPQKSVFGTDVVAYLGHNLVGTYGVTMTDSKIASIKGLPTPKSVPDLRSILGFMAYYRHFIPGFSALSAPITKLLKKDVPWDWTQEQDIAFETLRGLMTQPGRVLRAIDPSRELVLHTDWSIHGIGAVLGQLDDDGNEYMCACISRSLNQHERNYPSYKGELLALAWAIRSFRQYLHGTHFRAVTDHQPLLWLMRARDLSGQYARWQVLLQEYDFDLEHRAGIKHTNADVLSRFPLPSSHDDTGARFDHDPVVGHVGSRHSQSAGSKCFPALEPTKTPPGPPETDANEGIDAFAPKFKCFHGLFNKDMAYMDSYHQDPLTRMDFDSPGETVQTARDTSLVSAIRALPAELVSQIETLASKVGKDVLTGVKPLPSHLLEVEPVDSHFHLHALNGPISVLELCGGLGIGLEAVLKSGYDVSQYQYCDIDLKARDAVRFRLANLTAKYPIQFPPSAWKNAFGLPQDITLVSTGDLKQHLGTNSQQWLIIAGWPCQEYSAAGRGRVGKRAALLSEVCRIIRWVQNTQQRKPPAYLLENVAMQHNFRHKHIRYPVFEELVSQLGEPVTFDAVQVGSGAHRLRNYWTNLGQPRAMQWVYDRLCAPTDKPADSLLGPNRSSMPVVREERSNSGVVINQPGKDRIVFPTLMSYPGSRAFRAGKAGSIWDGNTLTHSEPDAEERERILGLDVSSTAAPNLTDKDRRQLLGQSMDLRALESILTLARVLRNRFTDKADSIEYHQFCDTPAPPPAESHRRWQAYHAALLSVQTPGDEIVGPSTLVGTAVQVGDLTQPTDIWEDTLCLEYLQSGKLPVDSKQGSRVRKRARLFSWFNNRLYRMVSTPTSPGVTHRLVPRPEHRDEIVSNCHQGLGHVGEKRTISALQDIYWWHGLTLDVSRVVACCKVCSRVRADRVAEQRDMQTVPHDYGLFYRWGLDYLGPLSPSALGHTHALIMIDYYSKWVEVIPVTEPSSATTRREVLLNLISRFGVPAEVISDNGGPFRDEFEKLCVERGIRNRNITANLPRSNGLAERCVQTIKRAIKKHCAVPGNVATWDTDGLAGILLGYRCTPQAATGFSPAQIIYAQNPATNADHYVSRLGPLHYGSLPQEIEADAAALLKRAEVAISTGVIVAENLRLSHARNTARFKALRSGYYHPKLHHFMAGDRVYLLPPKSGTTPGGALGIKASDEILTVKDVKPTGVIILTNQVGTEFRKHIEECAPCHLPNVDSTVHPDQASVPATQPCVRCLSHLDAAEMLLCDGCNAGWHTYCLPEPLKAVPKGTWLCPDCTSAGLNERSVQRRQKAYVDPLGYSPNLTLPSPARRNYARKLAKQWHGTVVVRQVANSQIYGRILFQGILAPRWFKIHWETGHVSEHTPRILPHLGQADESKAPKGLLPPPPAVHVYAILDGSAAPDWSIRSPEEIQLRLQAAMPGSHLLPTCEQIHRHVRVKLRRLLTVKAPEAAVRALTTVLDFACCANILNPWAATHAVAAALQIPHARIIHNDSTQSRPAHLHMDPLEPMLYEKVCKAMVHLDAVVGVPPPLFADLALVNAMQYADKAVCLLVPRAFMHKPTLARLHFIRALRAQQRLLEIRFLSDTCELLWVCVFADEETHITMVRDPAEGSEVAILPLTAM